MKTHVAVLLPDRGIDRDDYINCTETIRIEVAIFIKGVHMRDAEKTGKRFYDLLLRRAKKHNAKRKTDQDFF